MMRAASSAIRRSFTPAGAMLGAVYGAPAWPQAYPVEPVRSIVPFPAGAELMRNATARWAQVARAAGIPEQ